MNQDMLEDLKQFVTVTISQQLSLQTDELRKEMEKLEHNLSGQIQELSDSVAEAMSDSNEEVDKQLKNHEHRITTLETKSA